MAPSSYTRVAIATLLAAFQQIMASPASHPTTAPDPSFVIAETSTNSSMITGGSMTLLANTDTATTSCGSQKYTADTYFVAVNAEQLWCGNTTRGTPIVVYCNDKQVLGTAVDGCKDCAPVQIQVQKTVWEACGFSTDDTVGSQVANWTIMSLPTDYQGLINH